MTRSQTLGLKASSLRERVNELVNLDELTDEQRNELAAKSAELRTVETQWRSAVEEEDRAAGIQNDEELTAEERELRQLRRRASLARYVQQGAQGLEVDGPEAEYSAARECPGWVPWDLIEPEQRQEERATTPAPSSIGATMHQIQPDVFLAPAAQALRVSMPTVGSGTQSYPVLSTSLTAAARDRTKAGPNTAAAVTVTSATFKRVVGSFELALEDIQKLPGLNSALQSNLSSVLGSAIDDLVVNGVAADSGKVTAVPGFFSASPVVSAATAESKNDTFQTYLSKGVSALDGKFARSIGDISMLVAPEVVAAAAITLQQNTATSAYDTWKRLLMGVTATDKITPASRVSPAMAVRHSVGGIVAVSPRWSGVQIIRDPYGQASEGIVKVTAVAMVAGVKVLRADSYKALSFKTAA